MHHHWMISKALFNAQKLVRKFTSPDELPPFAFDAETVDHIQGVFDGLFLLLDLVPKVKELKLSLPSDYVNDSFVSFPYDSIFPVTAYWPNLTTFSVEHLVLYVNQLVKLLTLIMPQLRELRLEMVELVDGNWSDVEAYVCDGRDDPTLRHPGLPPDSPSHKSREFLQGLFRDCEKFDPEHFAAKMVRILKEHATTLHRQREIQEQLVDELV
ncbi:hypothetical protein ABVK25_002850 [Lepraria finkii]|uniref:Uncharacterized protein n=1 Tax=Lepraria finkii TaxID=1340010 RepID=A0ABR4BJB8_9LECA